MHLVLKYLALLSVIIKDKREFHAISTWVYFNIYTHESVMLGKWIPIVFNRFQKPSFNKADLFFFLFSFLNERGSVIFLRHTCIQMCHFKIFKRKTMKLRCVNEANIFRENLKKAFYCVNIMLNMEKNVILTCQYYDI